MKTALLLVIAYLIHCEGAAVVEARKPVLNNRPIIGVLAQEYDNALYPKYIPEKYTSYIAASYVKAIESTGARVVPIKIGQNRSYYEDIMSKINGALFPGGDVQFNASNGYADAGEHIFNIAMEMADTGDYFPVYGICLGFELLWAIAAGRGKQDVLSNCASSKSVPLHFTKDFKSSKVFNGTPQDMVELLATENVTVNSHHFCVEDRNVENLITDWHVTSHSRDENGKEFIATVEHRRYPIFGTQFHPEKPLFEWTNHLDIAHSTEARKASRYFLDFFVNECRKNFNSFNDPAEENKYLIYNYAPTYTGKFGDWFEQSYLFDPK
ncbi:peptidase c26 domain-containing protein [Phthorimaea operculella]|nr:peptidase c26 domain-containing protein [Phthorimaea operculella]